MRNTERGFVALLLGLFIVVSGCGSSSTKTDVVEDVATVEKSSSATCSQSNLCVGTYSTNVISGEGLTNGPCPVNYIDSSEKITIVFEKTDTCDFLRITASGEIGSNWAALASVVSSRLVVHHKGTDVYLIRVFPDE